MGVSMAKTKKLDPRIERFLQILLEMQRTAKPAPKAVIHKKG